MTDRVFSFFKEGEPAPFINIFGWEIRFYSFAWLISGLVTYLTIKFFWKREGYSSQRLSTLTFLCIISIIIGARLWYVFERLIYSPENPFANSNWFAFWRGGLSVQGGIVVTPIVLLTWIYFRRKELDWRVSFSIIAPAFMLGLGIGRWGNYTNHEIFGREVSADHSSIVWLPNIIKENMRIFSAIKDPNGNFLYFDNVAKYYVPLFLYDFIVQVIGYLIIVWIFNLFGWFKPGSTGGLFFFWEGLSRIILEPLRNESYDFYSNTAVLFLVIGLAFFIFFEFEFQIKRLIQFRPKPRYLTKKDGYWLRYIRVKYFQEKVNKPDPLLGENKPATKNRKQEEKSVKVVKQIWEQGELDETEFDKSFDLYEYGEKLKKQEQEKTNLDLLNDIKDNNSDKKSKNE